MADVRALLKAKRQEATITHPLASYNQSGQLRCKVCGILIKHASAWEGHLGSKAHRTKAVAWREEEKAQAARRLRDEAEQQERNTQGKRKAEDDNDDDEEDIMAESRSDFKKLKLDSTDTAQGFPSNFFSNGQHIPLPSTSDDEDENENVPSITTTATTTLSALDLEYERFQQEVVMAEPDQREAYNRATIFAEPNLAQETSGFPKEESDEVHGPDPKQEDELRRHKEQEEKELIMDRILNEERAQEDADMKVIIMKSRLEVLKRRREATKLAKTTV